MKSHFHYTSSEPRQCAVLALLFSVSSGCGGVSENESGDPVEARTEPIVCGGESFQHVESFTTDDGITQSFISEHSPPVGYFGCSGTLVGDGLFFTAAHCIEPTTLNSTIRFNKQLDPQGNERPTESYRVLQILEDATDGTDRALLRLAFNPDDHWGMAAFDPAASAEGDILAMIGFPAIASKRADAGRIHHILNSGDMFLEIDGVGGDSGSAVFSALSGFVAGMVHGDVNTQCPVGNRAHSMPVVYGNSAWIKKDNGAARMYSFTSQGLTNQRWTENTWRGRWHHIVPGRFASGSGLTKQLFFYDSILGEGRFYSVGTTGLTAIGNLITGVRKTWTQIVPLQLDPSTPQDELFFYSARDGRGSYYRTDGTGTITLVGSHFTNLPKLPTTSGQTNATWRLVAAADVSSDHPGPELLAYAPNQGEMQLYSTTSSGGLSLITTLTGLGPNISHMVTGDFSTSSGQEVLLYSQTDDSIVLLDYASTPPALTRFGARSAFNGSRKYTQVAAGNFVGGASLLFYEPSPTDIYGTDELSGTIRFYSVAGDGTLTLTLTQTSVRNRYAKLLAAPFTMSGSSPETSVIFYRRYSEW